MHIRVGFGPSYGPGYVAPGPAYGYGPHHHHHHHHPPGGHIPPGYGYGPRW